MPMDGWSVPRNGSVLDCGETGGSCETDGICVDIGNNNSLNGTDKLQAYSGNAWRWAVCGLVQTFLGCEGEGGYEWVSDKGLWGLVAEECGLDVGVKTCLKLIYFKYLDQLDQWLLGILRDGSLDKGEGECGGKLDSVLEELGTEFRGLILGGTGPKEKDDGVFELESERTDNCVDLDKEKSILNLSIVLRRAEKSPNDDDEKNCVDGGDDVAIQDPIIAKKSSFSRKRKRESFSGMLNWVREIAKHPEEPYKGNKNGNEVFSTQILRVRESLLIRRKVHTKEEQSLLQLDRGQNVMLLMSSMPVNFKLPSEDAGQNMVECSIGSLSGRHSKVCVHSRHFMKKAIFKLRWCGDPFFNKPDVVKLEWFLCWEGVEESMDGCSFVFILDYLEG
ncbi:AT-rich interactive domain-containing protein 2 [Vitis vinifera]|uniref:AT-rich interactive domain-containing protein 2 n=1 Tax=Vitis vinifera TaxID=29760 RepID=A0A438E6M9_VITVI|nr:AT-rich interactive domain-containing protein 2 [Vitis vinifera]